MTDDSIKQVKDISIVTSRKLHDLVNRSHNLFETGKIEELQAEASNFGHTLLKIAQYNINALGDGVKEELTSIGRRLHLVETMRLYMDGGGSMQAILDSISESNELLCKLVAKIQFYEPK